MWIVNVRYADGTTARRPCAGEECDAIRYAAWLASKGNGVAYTREQGGTVSEELNREDMIAWAYARCRYLAPLALFPIRLGHMRRSLRQRGSCALPAM